jgi:DNA-binding transcriptional LysR family regulator
MGLIERSFKQIQPTEKGRQFLDDLLTLFVAE